MNAVKSYKKQLFNQLILNAATLLTCVAPEDLVPVNSVQDHLTANKTAVGYVPEITYIVNNIKVFIIVPHVLQFTRIQKGYT